MFGGPQGGMGVSRSCGGLIGGEAMVTSPNNVANHAVTPLLIVTLGRGGRVVAELPCGNGRPSVVLIAGNV